jgi:GTP-binding protein Era
MTDPGAISRCGFCAVIGAPNAGKSTLVNALAGSKVSIVSRKVQTTRARIRAIVIAGSSQIVFVDTPGIFKPKRKLDELMVGGAWTGAEEADVVLVVVDAQRGLEAEAADVLGRLDRLPKSAILALNKIDLVEKSNLLALAAACTQLHAFEAVFMISAKTGSGLAELKRHIAERMPEGPWLYPEDQAADVPLRFLAAEITREKIFDRLHDELPYASSVETERWEERRDGSVRIHQVIYVEREGQRRIVLGKGGQQIKTIGQTARRELETLLERQVHLFLFVKVREDWTDDPSRIAAMGIEPE